MHIQKTLKFETEDKAQKFADSLSGPETYVRGPTFMDVKKIFKGDPCAGSMKDYWSVSYDQYK